MCSNLLIFFFSNLYRPTNLSVNKWSQYTKDEDIVELGSTPFLTHCEHEMKNLGAQEGILQGLTYSNIPVSCKFALLHELP